MEIIEYILFGIGGLLIFFGSPSELEFGGKNSQKKNLEKSMPVLIGVGLIGLGALLAYLTK